MRELLSNNIALHYQLEAIQGLIHFSATPGSLRPRIREVPSLISWVFCFLAYVAVCTPDQTTRNMLSYCRQLIWEALRHGGSGWQEYDRIFQQQLAIDTLIWWNLLKAISKQPPSSPMALGAVSSATSAEGSTTQPDSVCWCSCISR